MDPEFKESDKTVTEKIDTVKYFLGLMKTNESEIKIFHYNLNAFLCVAHSARDIIKECDVDWFENQPIVYDDIGLYFWKLRVVSVHYLSTTPKRTTVISEPMKFCIAGEKPSPVLEVPQSEVKSGYYFNSLDINTKENATIKRKIKAELEKLKPKFGKKIDDPDNVFSRINQVLNDKDVITLCNEYIQMISTVWEDYKVSRSPKK